MSKINRLIPHQRRTPETTPLRQFINETWDLRRVADSALLITLGLLLVRWAL